jgi:ribulose-phosphate 3-epimerase
MPEIIPVINTKTTQKLKERINLLKNFDGIFQIDIADGKFTSWKTWNRPGILKKIKKIKGRFELHLMVFNPEQVLPNWLESSPKRVIIHCEAIKDFSYIYELCHKDGIELGIAINPETSFTVIDKYLKKIDLVVVLGVTPGPSGQKFEWFALDRIQKFKKKHPKVLCEIDGGIDKKILETIKKSGVDFVAIGSAIFESNDPLAMISYFRKELADK